MRRCPIIGSGRGPGGRGGWRQRLDLVDHQAKLPIATRVTMTPNDMELPCEELGRIVIVRSLIGFCNKGTARIIPYRDPITCNMVFIDSTESQSPLNRMRAMDREPRINR